jgi:hypothetical protein
MVRVITSIVSALGWVGYIIVTNPGLVHFGYLHDWHGSDEPELIALIFNTIAAAGFGFAIPLAFGGPRWMLWACALLTLTVAVVWALPAVPGTIRQLHYWYYEREPVYGRLQYLWTVLGSAIALDLSLLSLGVLCFYSVRRQRPNQAMQRTAGRLDS